MRLFLLQYQDTFYGVIREFKEGTLVSWLKKIRIFEALNLIQINIKVKSKISSFIDNNKVVAVPYIQGKTYKTRTLAKQNKTTRL